jgi:signal-transduction protein with cAMP-binding, CBS, and nucleotidyltransferase domain
MQNKKGGLPMKTAEDILNEKRTPKMVSVPADTPIAEVVRLMVKNNVGAMLVRENNDIAGIWTERDFLRSALEPGFDPHTARIRDYMKRELKSAPHDTPILSLLEMFLGLYIRHILIQREGNYTGLLSIGDVLRASLLEKDLEIRELNKIASWGYYENWGWDRKFKT